MAVSFEDEAEEQQGDDEEINDERVQMLGIILTGGMVSMERMHSAELHALLGPTTSKSCTSCDMGANEDAEHIFWTCLAWKKVREKFLERIWTLIKKCKSHTRMNHWSEWP